MASASRIQRVNAACVAVLIGLVLLAPPPSHAVFERPGDAPSQEIGDDPGSSPTGVPPNSTRRGAESTAVSLEVAVATKGTASPTPGLRLVQAGSEAPALTRWRIAHATSTSSP